MGNFSPLSCKSEPISFGYASSHVEAHGNISRRNPFANGAGLGMSICDTIIRRMGGRVDVTSALGEGTTMRILVPLEFCPASDEGLDAGIDCDASRANSPTLPASITATEVPPLQRRHERRLSRDSTRWRTRVISDELTSLFNPGAPLASPFEEEANFDFSRAVSNAQASVGAGQQLHKGKLRHRASSTASSRVLGRTGTDGDFVDEMAKLSVGTASSPQPLQHAPANGDFFSLSPPTAATSPSSEMPGGGPSPFATTKSLSPPTGGNVGFIPTSPTKRFAERVRVLIADDNAIGRSILTKLFSGKVRFLVRDSLSVWSFTDPSCCL